MSYGYGYYGDGLPSGTKERLDVINRAMRRIGVKAEDEALTADQFANASEVLDTLLAELAGETARS